MSPNALKLFAICRKAIQIECKLLMKFNKPKNQDTACVLGLTALPLFHFLLIEFQKFQTILPELRISRSWYLALTSVLGSHNLI
ncbi:hypothetical protein INT44_003072 [Umbelopsis vinacea]|uniref:Uncharacterized protein n=1 Tax=Umbelopsis vinacea TaxID=44442 RepID=A0A8H7UI82_9FUNG|nr:hypothetical protein INT44_003072 [Umbelopsis vinacea]